MLCHAAACPAAMRLLSSYRSLSQGVKESSKCSWNQSLSLWRDKNNRKKVVRLLPWSLLAPSGTCYAPGSLLSRNLQQREGEESGFSVNHDPFFSPGAFRKWLNIPQGKPGCLKKKKGETKMCVGRVLQVSLQGELLSFPRQQQWHSCWGQSRREGCLASLGNRKISQRADLHGWAPEGVRMGRQGGFSRREQSQLLFISAWRKLGTF